MRGRPALALWVAGALMCVAGRADAARRHRAIELRWDFRMDSPFELEVWVDCARPPTADIYTCDEARKIKGPDAYRFRLQSSDQVTLVVVAAVTDDPGSLAYVVTGSDLSDKDIDALKKLLGSPAGATARLSASGGRTATVPEPKADVRAVTDPLVAGGKLTVTFSLKRVTNGRETTTRTSDAVTFLVSSEPPRLTVSFGLGFSTAASPSVALSKTSTIVTFQKNGKSQQAYQQVIRLQDADATLKPIQSLMTFANFRVAGPVYVSAGIQINEKLFDGPVVGATYRIPVGERRGVNLTLGVHFNRENAIDPASGFENGQLIDPTLGLTVADIPTRTIWHRRLALGITADF